MVNKRDNKWGGGREVLTITHCLGLGVMKQWCPLYIFLLSYMLNKGIIAQQCMCEL